jgi:ATP-binding cassette subfamily F protein 3
VRPDLTVDGARERLARYRFFGDEVYHAVGALSGGERCRLALLKVSLRPHNLLALDEPTNHLDIPAVEVLEGALRDYEGTLIVISHDRAFLDAVVAKVLWVEDGTVRVFEGNYSEARRRVRGEGEAEAEERPAEPERPPEEARPGALTREESRQRRRVRQKAEKRLRELEGEIARYEARSKELHEQLARDPDGDWQRLNALANEEQELRARLERRYAEWARVSETLERIREA